jgi:GT2 family glycosyltransferase
LFVPGFGVRALTWFVQGALIKLWFAFRDKRLPRSPRWWLKAIRLHWQETSRRPHRHRQPIAFDQDALDESYRRWLDQRSAASEGPPAAGVLDFREISMDIVALVDDRSSGGIVFDSIRSDSVDLPSVYIVAREPFDPLPSAISSENVTGLRPLLRPDGSWLPPGKGTYIVLLDSTTRLSPGALGHIARGIRSGDGKDWWFTDDDRIDARGIRYDPYLKPAFNLLLALDDDYATRVSVVKRSTLEAAGGLRAIFEEAQLYDLLLRVVSARGTVGHIPEVCGHRAHAVPEALGIKHRRALEEAFADLAGAAPTMTDPSLQSRLPNVMRIGRPPRSLAVTIVIPSRNRPDLLRRCIDSLRRTVDPDGIEIILADDQSTDESARDLFDELDRDRYFRCRTVRVPRPDNRFNYSRLMNAASRLSRTPVLLHLNDDVEAMEPGWLDQMVEWLHFPDTGVVGAKLVYPDGSLQHAGVVVAMNQGAFEHFHHRHRADERGYQWWPHRIREVSAVTGACLLTRTASFLGCGGFDEHRFGVQFNDIDYCLRLRAAGQRIVYDGRVSLWHRTSASRGNAYNYRETLAFLKKYHNQVDPFLSPNLDALSMCGGTPSMRQRAMTARMPDGVVEPLMP